MGNHILGSGRVPLSDRIPPAQNRGTPPSIKGVSPRAGGGIGVTGDVGKQWGKWLYDTDTDYWDRQYEQDLREGHIPRYVGKGRNSYQTKEEYMQKRGSEMAAAQYMKNYRKVLQDPEAAIRSGAFKQVGPGAYEGRFDQ